LKKVNIYKLRDLLHEMHYIKFADTDKTATAERFQDAYEEAIEICNDRINSMKPLK